MILDNMTYREIAIHLTADMQQAIAFSRNIKFTKYRSQAIKLKRYPIFFKPIYFMSTQHNRWIVVPHAHSKKDLDYLPYYLGCIYRQHEKTFLFMRIDAYMERPRTLNLIFTSDFFERFAERQKLKMFEVNKEHIIIDFIKTLYRVGLKEIIEGKSSKIIMFSESGMALGYQKANQKALIIFKTYVTAQDGPSELQRIHKEWMFIQEVF